MKKNVFFYSKKTSQPRKKLKFCMKKSQKNDKKRYQKDHPAPQKLKFCKKKSVFFYSKIPPILAKNKTFEWKKKNVFLFFFFCFFPFFFLLDFFSLLRFLFKITLKKMKFCMKNLKSSYPWWLWKKKSRPPTSPNF